MRELLVAAAYTVAWMVASSGLILLNKYILSNLDFHYPLTLSRRGGARRCITRARPCRAPRRARSHADARRAYRAAHTRSLGMGFSSLASATLIHVFNTHKLEHRMTRDFYARRIFPLGFLMARRPPHAAAAHAALPCCATATGS
jgi:hypothetical protein